jgi:hypothetical protein
MNMIWNILRVTVAASIIVTVAEISKKSPRLGALLLSLPVVSILAFIFSWFEHHDLPAFSRMARETLVLVPLSLPFFVPLALAERLGWGFWFAMAVGVALASASIIIWFAVTGNR